MLSRVADSLYWVSRYLERAEHTARLLDVQVHLALDEAPWSASLGWIGLVNGLRVELPVDHLQDTATMVAYLGCDRANASSILVCLENARENARQIREQISSEMWEALNRLYLAVRCTDGTRLWSEGPQKFLQKIQRGVQLFYGVADATMSHAEGWQFLRLGRFLERAIGRAWLLDAHFGIRGTTFPRTPTAEEHVAWSGLLRGCTAFEAYCKVYSAALNPQRVLEFLLLDAEFPHSVRFCVREIEQALISIGEWTGTPRTAAVKRRAGALAARLSFAGPDDISAAEIGGFLKGVVRDCIAVHEGVYERYIGYAVDAALRGSARAS
jgi:uncharacterized alpha-E superfamily protein